MNNSPSRQPAPEQPQQPPAPRTPDPEPCTGQGISCGGWRPERTPVMQPDPFIFDAPAAGITGDFTPNIGGALGG